ncbi:MAG: hypothetical protein K2Q25_13695 [Mycobacteriaceae bacterium]|nr:hypothetical protein [Mycobacteriaceae bacterium]
MSARTVAGIDGYVPGWRPGVARRAGETLSKRVPQSPRSMALVGVEKLTAQLISHR